MRSTEWVAAALAAALLGTMFLDWYSGEGRAVSLNAFEAFSAVDVLMLLAVAMVFVLVILTLSMQTPAVPVAWASLTAIVATVGSIVLFIRLLSVPGEGLVREIGPTLGLSLMLALTAAIWSGLRNERPGHGAHAARARARIADIETLPAPPASGER